MTQRKKNSAKKSSWKELLSQEEDFLKELVKEVVQQVLEGEMEEALGASKGERTGTRLGYRSGYYSRTLVTRVGKLELRVPQDRQGRFSTKIFERYQRSEKALVSALSEMYVQGVSTRKVKAITEGLCGHSFSAATISEINKKLDGELKKFSERELDQEYPYLIVVSDDHAGLREAISRQLPQAVWQRCYVHFLRNSRDHLPRKGDDDCLRELRWIYDRRDLEEAKQDLGAWLNKWQEKYPKLCDWVEENIEETLSFYRLPLAHHKHLKSTNMLERLNEEIKRRTWVVRIFPNASSCLRLVRALAVSGISTPKR